MNNIILIDLEATCCDNDEISRGDMEIIEIGAVAVINNKIYSSIGIMVKPKLNPILTSFCKELTGITDSDLENAPYFKQAFEDLDRWIMTLPINIANWGSWGDYDKGQFEKDMRRNHIINNGWFAHHRNIKAEFARKFGKRCGVPQALEMIGETFEGNHHRALDDTRNIFKLYKALYE